MSKSETRTETDSLVILCHGVAAFGYDLDPLADVLRAARPSSSVVAPDAPFAFEHGPGRQWYSQDDITPANRRERVVAARPAFDALVSGLIDEHRLAGRLDRVALVGFSQGAIMVEDALASGRWPVAAMVALSGRLATPEPLTPAPATPLLLVHGADDPVVPPSESERAFALLKAAGVAVELHRLAGVGHVVSPQAAALAAGFVSRAFGQRALTS
jgi:phospholipase/carboxylesterase